MTYNYIESLYDDILRLLQDLVVKRHDLAQAAETVDTYKNFQLYYACVVGSQYFNNFERFDLDILERFLSPAQANSCYYDPTKIPEDLRADIIKAQSNRVIETFEEQNNYYRMLSGYPDREDRNWIYIGDYTDIPSDIPIHEMTDEQIALLESRGVIDRLKESHPDAKYLDYLGVHRIEVLDARLAKPYEILRLGVPTNSRVQEMFEEEYYGARRYVMANIYHREYFNNKTLYYPFIGIIMVSLAIRNTLVPSDADYLNFDEILNLILKSYGLLTYFEKFPFIFKRRLVLALDTILAKKGTDGVLLDICRLFSFDNFTANRYHLLKTRKLDENGLPLDTGDPLQDYDLTFVKADIGDHEIDYSSDNLESYEGIVNNDYLWQLTEEEQRKIMGEDFNTMMTKYIDVEAAYDLSSLTFEVCYFLNMLLESRDNIGKIHVTNQYATGGVCTLYTMIVFLLAGLAQRSGFDGNIVYDPENIADILRFDFDAMADEIRTIVDKYELQVDVVDPLIPGYTTVELDKPTGQATDYRMLEIYLNNKALYDAVVEEMKITTDIRRYIALSNVRDAMYTSAMQRKNFIKTDGTPASTYHEMLTSLDPTLVAKLDALADMEDEDNNEINKVLLYTLEKLEDLFSSPELRYLFLNTPNTYGTLISKYLRTAINVFKASSVQLQSINVFFYLGDSEPIRVIEQNVLHKHISLPDTVHVIDDVALHKTIVLDDTVRVMDKAYTNI